MIKFALISIALLLIPTSTDGQGAASCPNYRDWRGWTHCLWFPVTKLVEDFTGACDIKIDTSKFQRMPEVAGMPDKCGHCSMKVRCRKREEIDGCFPFEFENEVCHEHGDVCTMPKFAAYNLGCKYEFASEYMRQCSNRADYPDWRATGMRRLSKVMPEFHCVEKDNECKCCCHPYHPSADGSQCVAHEAEQCEPWSEYNEFSTQCAWFPPSQMRQLYMDHCQFEVPISEKAKAVYDKLEKMPDGTDFPNRCGYCSYKVKCRKRDRMSRAGKPECFPIEAQKRACGPADGEGYGDVCDLPKFMGGCNFTENLHKIAGAGSDSRMKKMPMGLQMGILKMAALLPHGKCVEKDDRCACCCHPYEPNAAGTECTLNPICRDAHDLGIEYDMNLEAQQSMWMW